MKRLCLPALFILLTNVASAEFVGISPLNYSVDQPTSSGSYDYHDWTGEQLIDGEFGGRYWTQDMGNGHAYEWLGWVNKDVNVDFFFDSTYQFESVVVHSTQDHLTNVVLPSVRVFGWSEQWVELDYLFVPEDEANNTGRRELVVSGLNGFIGDRLRVSLERSNDGPWTFTDEIVFNGQSAPAQSNITADVNAPLSFMSVACLGLAGLVRRRGTARLR